MIINWSMYFFLFYCVFLIVLFVIPSLLNYKKTGINPFRFGGEDNAINYVGKIYKWVSVLAFLTLVINAFLPQVMIWFMPIEFLRHAYFFHVGSALLHVSFFWVLAAQRNMSKEWRMGIDTENKVNLVTSGLFQITRNPVFLGIISVFIGLFFILPSALTLLLFVLSVVVIQVQVRLEEDFLRTVLGSEYENYLKQTKRWLL